MTIVKSAGNVSGGLDKKIRARMVSNVVIEVAIGLVPVVGDFVDCFFQSNTKNVLLLEAVLAQRAVDLAEKAKLDAEDGYSPERNNTMVNDPYDTHPYRQDTGRRPRPTVRNSHVFTDGTYDEESRSGVPAGYDQRHAGVHQRLQAKESARKAQPAQTSVGGGFMSRLQSRGSAGQDARPAQTPRSEYSRGNGTDREYDGAPAQPPRSGHTRRHQVGSF